MLSVSWGAEAGPDRTGMGLNRSVREYRCNIFLLSLFLLCSQEDEREGKSRPEEEKGKRKGKGSKSGD